MVGGLQGTGIQVDAGIDHTGLFLGRSGHASMVGGGHQENASVPEIAQDRAGQGRPFFGIGAGAQLVGQNKGPDSGPVHYRYEVGHVGTEGRQRLLDALLVADVGVDAIEAGEMGFVGRDVQTRMGHYRQKPHRLQGHRLAAGVGAGDQHHAGFRAEFHSHRDHPSRQQGVARPYQLQTPFRRLLGRQPRGDCLEGGRVTGLGRVQVQAGYQVQCQQQVFAAFSHETGKLPQHPLFFPLLGQTRFPPAVAQIDGLHRFDEDGGPAVGDIVDDPGHPGPHLGLDQEHHAAVALSDQWLLHQFLALQPAQVPLHYLVETVLGLAGLGPQPPQNGTGMVQDLSGGADGACDIPFQLGHVRDVARDAGQHRHSFLAGQDGAVITSGAGQFPYGVEFDASQKTTQQSPLQQLAEVLLRSEFQRAGLFQELPGFGRFLLAGGDLQKVLGRREGHRPLPAHDRTGIGSQLLPDLVELQQRSRLAKAVQGAGRGNCIDGERCVLTRLFSVQFSVVQQKKPSMSNRDESVPGKRGRAAITKR